jgi:hypothetical protein
MLLQHAALSVSSQTIPALLLEEKETNAELTSVPRDVIPGITDVPLSTNENLTAEKPDNVSGYFRNKIIAADGVTQ